MLEDYIHLHERVSRKKIPLKDRGAVITEKLSELLDVGVGDKIGFRDGDDLTFEVEIQGITENYLSHYIYLSPDTYEEISFKSPDFNTLLFTLKDPKGLDEKAFKEELMEHEGVLGIMLTMGLIDEVQDTLGSLDYVILILVLSAGALAFVVLYNLTNINITERIREIATLKCWDSGIGRFLPMFIGRISYYPSLEPWLDSYWGTFSWICYYDYGD